MPPRPARLLPVHDSPGHLHPSPGCVWMPSSTNPLHPDANPMGPHSRRSTPIRPPGVAVYRPHCRSGPDCEWSALRWRIEVTFQETRAHLGLETQRQWSDRAMSRTTPVLLGLFPWTTLAIHPLGDGRLSTPRPATWHVKSESTFVDAIALVRRHLWIASETFCTSGKSLDFVQRIAKV